MILEILLVNKWQDISESVSDKTFLNYFGLDDGLLMHFPYLSFKNQIRRSFILGTTDLGKPAMVTTACYKAMILII
jgi:hypothetical protein